MQEASLHKRMGSGSASRPSSESMRKNASEAEASADTRSNRTAAGAGGVEPGEEENEKIEDGAPMSAAEAPEQAAAMDAGTRAWR